MSMEPTRDTSHATPHGTPMPFREALTANLRPLYRYIVTRARFFDAGEGAWADDNRPIELIDSVVAEALVRQAEWDGSIGMYRWLRGLADDVLARDARRSDQPDSISLDRLTDESPGHRQHVNDTFLIAEDTTDEQPMISEASDIQALSPEERVVSDEFQRIFITALRDLPDDLREPFLLHTRDGYTSDQVAKMEGIPVDEARQKFNDASEQLRTRLAREYDGLDEEDDLPALDTMYEAIEDISLDSDYIDRIATALEER
jgi:RNA polymerase sigma factor (sigma-70 family)